MYAFSGILSALLRRARSGEGANVKIAMLDALGEWMMYPMYRAAYAELADATGADQPSRRWRRMAHIAPRTAR